MDELDYFDIQTNVQDGPSVQSVINNNPLYLNTVVQEVPQIQSVIQDNVAVLSSVINAPFVEVTSVNGMSGDVIVEPLIYSFQPSHFYKKNTLVSYNGNLYWAKTDFTSGEEFNLADWNLIEATGVSTWDDITNKPEFAPVAFSGSYNALSDKPNINNASLVIKRNNATLGAFTANSDSDVEVNIEVPTNTNQLTNGAGFVTSSALPQNLTDLNNDDNFLRGTNLQQIVAVSPFITNSMLANQVITNNKIAWSDFLDESQTGRFILQKDINGIRFEKEEYYNGQILASAINTTTLTWNGTSPSRWSGGSWVQYGIMATDLSDKSVLKIVVPDNEAWVIRLEHTTGVVHPASDAYCWSGIYRSNGATTMSSLLTSGLTGTSGAHYEGQRSETCVELSSGVYYFGVYVRTANTSNATWYGGGPKSPSATGDTWNMGNSCVLTASLLERRVS